MKRPSIEIPKGAVPIVVADTDMSWTRDLFSHVAQFNPVFMLEFREPFGAWHHGWRRLSDLAFTQLGPNLYRKRYLLPTGWFNRYPGPAMSMLARVIRRDLRRWGIGDYRLALSFPQYQRLLAHLDPNSLIYYWSDEFRTYWPDRAEYIADLEQRLARCSDLVVCSSRVKAEALRSEVPEAGDRIEYLIHGIDPQWIVPQPLYKPAPLPAEASDWRRPVLGYFGAAGNVDYVLLERLMVRVPNVTLALIGPTTAMPMPAEQEAAFSRVAALSNTRQVGFRPRADAMPFVRAFDICLLPYQLNPQVNASNPSKFRDYFATTRPIVSTGLPDAELFRDLIDIGHTHEEFIDHVISLLQRDCNDGRYDARWAHVQEHTWDRVAERLFHMIERHCPRSARE
jgi:teichuronic acid biosynthesis glycosyltransferase TuaH